MAQIGGDSMTAAWLAAMRYLQAQGRAVFDLAVEIADPAPERSDQAVVTALGRRLADAGCQSVETVANTIFPAALAATSRDRAHLYARYRAILPRLRRLRGNRRGLYFARLIDYPLLTGDQANQLETLIGDLTAQLARRGGRGGPLRHAYEALVFAPGRDRLPQGFPCLTALSFHLDEERLRLIATYRNQYYVQKALGNFLGLSRLQRFVAEATGLAQGPLTVRACHAQIDPSFGKRAVAALLADCDPAAHPRLALVA
jgi:thymidylate synthase